MVCDIFTQMQLFFTNFAASKTLTTKKLSQKRKQTSCCCSDEVQNSTSLTKRYSVSKINLLRSGDVELNPGPEQNVGNHNKLSVDSTTLLNFRLRQLGLRALMLVVQVTAFLGQYHINCMVIRIITFTSDKLLFSTLGITLNVSLKAIPRICGMVT